MDELKVGFHRVLDLNDNGAEVSNYHYMATISTGEQSNHILYASFSDMFNSLQPENIEGTLRENLPGEDYYAALRLIKQNRQYRLNGSYTNVTDV